MSYIDTRELNDELTELNERRELALSVRLHAEDYTAEEIAEGLEGALTDEEENRRLAIQVLAEEVGSEFPYGETMIPDWEFVRYAEELADDCGYMSDAKASEWPFRHIDWAKAADELRVDYTEVEWDGETFLVRTT